MGREREELKTARWRFCSAAILDLGRMMSSNQSTGTNKVISTSKPHILFIVGSLREASLNRQLAHVAIKIIGDRATCEILEWDDVPLFNQDIETPAPKAVSRVREAVMKADALWFATPENNHSIPGALKNLIDWLSRPVGKDEPAVIMGKLATASTVAGSSCGRYVHAALLPVFEYLKMPQPNAPYASKCFSRQEFSSSTLEVSDALKVALSQQIDALFAKLA